MVGKVYLSMAAGVRDEDNRLLADANVCGLQWPLTNINMYVVCMCVCVYYYHRRGLVGVHLYIVMKVLVIRRRAHVKGGSMPGSVAFTRGCRHERA